MRRYILLTIILLGCIVPASARETININRNWKFFYGSEVSSDNALRVNLPHMWNNDALGGTKDYLRGIGNYLKNINIPSSWKGRRVFIKCYGANSISNVMINGKHIGEHRAGYTTFIHEITDNLNYGQTNYFWIMVNNSPQMDVLPIAGDATQYGGLFRDIELIVTGNEAVSLLDNGSDGIYVKQLSVTKEKVSGEIIVKVDGRTNTDVVIEADILDENGNLVTSGTSTVGLHDRLTSVATIPFAVEKPILWNGKNNPYLYTVSVKVKKGSVETDRLNIKTGFRNVSVDPKRGFLLNGEPYPIKGVVVTQDRAMVGSAISSYHIKEDFDLILNMGANAVRVAGVCHNPEFYKLCDKHGILVYSDFPIVGATYLTDKSFIESESFRNNGLMQINEIMRQQYNHPSVVMWGLFSELSFRGDNPVGFIREINSLAKKEDPSRLTVAASNEDGDINFITDLILWNQNLGWKEGLPSDAGIWIKQLKSKWRNLRSGISYAAGASIYHQDESLTKPFMNGNWHPERWQTYFHEEYYNYFAGDKFFWGVFIGNMFDYGAAARTWGEGNGINDYGLVTFDRKYCKDSYYLYKANWNGDDPFVYITERRWDVRGGRKQNIRVYSNCKMVELFVNGISYGKMEPINGTFIWKDIEMEMGENLVEAKADGISDKIVIQIASIAVLR